MLVGHIETNVYLPAAGTAGGHPYTLALIHVLTLPPSASAGEPHYQKSERLHTIGPS